MKIVCPTASFVTVELSGVEPTEFEDPFLFDLDGNIIRDMHAFIGDALHGIQQGVLENLTIHGYKVDALVMDQTDGSPISPDDILFVDHPSNKFQRVCNITANTFDVSKHI